MAVHPILASVKSFLEGIAALSPTPVIHTVEQFVPSRQRGLLSRRFQDRAGTLNGMIVTFADGVIEDVYENTAGEYSRTWPVAVLWWRAYDYDAPEDVGFSTLVGTIMTEILKNATLSNTVEHAGPARAEAPTYEYLVDTLCHHVMITFPVEELLQETLQ